MTTEMRVDFPTETLEQLRVLADQQATTPDEIIKQAIDWWVENRCPKGGSAMAGGTVHTDEADEIKTD